MKISGLLFGLSLIVAMGAQADDREVPAVAETKTSEFSFDALLKAPPRVPIEQWGKDGSAKRPWCLTYVDQQSCDAHFPWCFWDGENCQG